MPPDDLTRWTTRLTGAASLTTEPAPPGVAPWFQAFRGDQPAPADRDLMRADDLLWRLLTNGASDMAESARALVTKPDGALLGGAADFGSVELWTECELSALHALWRIARQTGDALLTARCDNAARFHLAETQPDNATNRPWAIHVFILLAAAHDDPEADLYAQTLLHNCLVQAGRPDPLSARILADGAECLAHATAAGDAARLS